VPSRLGKRVPFLTAAKLVTLLEVAQQQHRLDRLLATLDRFDLLAVANWATYPSAASAPSCCSRSSRIATSDAAY